LAGMGVRKQVYLVPNTIRTQTFANSPELREEARKRLGVGKDEFVVLGSGQVQPRKRLDSFVAAAKALPKLRFVWVGGMPFKGLAAESGEMDRLMNEHSDNMDFPGLLERDRLIDYYRASDLFFLPSNQETFGIVVVEAAAAGLPVLLRDINQYKQTFGDGYEAGTDETFKQIIERFYSDHMYYKHWQEAAKGIARRYDARAGAKRLMEVYSEVMGIELNQTK